MNTLTSEGHKLLDHYEKSYPFLYDDQAGVYPPKMWKPGTKVKGFLTIGAGHKCSPEEIKKYSGIEVSKEEIHRLRDIDLGFAAKLVDARFKGLKPYERDALIILAFNIPEALDKSPGKWLRKGDLPKAFAAWLRFNKVTNQKTGELEIAEGLFYRRQSEMLLYQYGRAVWFEEAK